MANASSTKKAMDLSAALSQLEPLGPDQYFIAFGPAGRQFCATPNGYSATFLPSKICDDILSDKIKKVVWATFGSESDSYYFFYKMKDGSPAHRAGKGAPTSLQPFVKWALSPSYCERAASLRVQLGKGRSWCAWAGDMWACRNIPVPLLSTLQLLSAKVQETKINWGGVLMSGALSNVTWHENGTYYVMAEEHWWCLETDTVKEAWTKLWHDEQELSTLAHVSFDPYSTTGDTFAFIKTQQDGKDVDFVVHFEAEGMIARLGEGPEQPEPASEPSEQFERDPVPEASTEVAATGTAESIERLQPEVEAHSPISAQQQTVHVPKPSGPQPYQWVFAKFKGRAHPRDSWELDLKKGEKLKVLQDTGKGWLIVQNLLGLKGYAHRSLLDFREIRIHVDPREAYSQWTADAEKLLQPGAVRSFPNLSVYVNACGREACQQIKSEPLGICAHDLNELLRGSGQYSLDFLKTQRNTWHPDKFARFCHPENRDSLKPQAEALFVLFGVLIDWLKDPPVHARMAWG